MDNASSLTKEEKQLNKQLNHHIDRYSYLRDWSELTVWLSKLKNILNDAKGTIIDKSSLLKKLSTSLNPSLPTAVHESTLEIYEIMMNKFIVVQNLEYLCLGLFSFYVGANIKGRTKVTQMLRLYLPKFGKDIRILATGLFVTILPSLNQMNDGLIKQVNELFDQLYHPQLLGSQIMIESIWIAILRSSSSRIAGLKFIASKLGKVEDNDENQQEDNFWDQSVLQPNLKKQQSVKQAQDDKTFVKKIDVKQYCPYIQTLTTNALIACIQDNNIIITKAALDFLYKYIPLKSQIISQQCKIKLANAIIWLLAKRDMGVTRKINFWVFGKPDAQNKFNINNKNIDFIIKPLINYLHKQNTIEPLKIIFNLFHEHDQLPTLIMKQITKDLIAFCMKEQNKTQGIKLMHRILDKIHDRVMLVASSLEESLIQAIEKKNYREADYLLQLSIYLLYKILRQAEIRKIFFRILKTIMRSYQITKWQDNQYMRNSLNAVLQMLEDYKDFIKQENMILTEQTEQSIQKPKKQKQQEKQLHENVKIYKILILKIEESASNQYQQELQNFCKIQMKIYEYFNLYDQQWTDNLVRNLYLKHPQSYLPAIQIIGQGLEKDGKLKKQLLKRSEEKSENCLSIAISKLWSIMSLGHLHFRVVPLLLRLIKFFPHFFQMIMKIDFDNNLEMAISKFNIFWQLSPKYPGIVSHQHLSEICKPGLFRMLNFLDNGNPLVKYNTKIWINDCFPAFNRVLDPILEIILQPKGFWYKTIKGQHVFAIQPQIQKINNCLRYLNSVIQTTGEKFFNFAQKSLTLHIRPYYEVFIGKEKFEQLEKIDKENKEKATQICYLRALFQIVVRYLGSKFVNLQVQEPGLELVCCELLEMIARKMKNPLICLKYFCLSIPEIFMALHFAILNGQHIFQIQLLNLIDCIFFSSQIKHSGQMGAKTLKTIISAPFFMKTILQGLNTGFPYIKQRFVEFINKSISLLLQFHGKCSQLISEILNTYLSKIMLVHSRKQQSSEQKDIEISKRNSEILILFNGIKQILSYFLNLTVKPFDKEREQHEPDSGIFNLYTWTSFVNLKIQKKTLLTSKSKKNAEQISRMMPNQLQHLLLTMTTCWTLSDLVPFYKISHQGLSEYNKTEFKQFNRQLQLLFGKQESEQSVETFIVDLVRVLINKYPKEIMNGMIKNWVSANTVEQKMKIIEIINLSAISIEHFYQIMSQSINSDYPKKRKSGIYLFQKSAEQQIIHFCQFYTQYSFQKKLVPTIQNQVNIWSNFLKFIRLFDNSRNIMTIFSLVELIDVFITKNNPKEILREEKMKKEMAYISNIFQELIMICNGKIKLAMSNRQEQYGLYSFVPLPTSVFEIYSTEIGKKQEAKVFYMFFDSLNPEKILTYCRVYAFIILKRVCFNYLQTLYSDNEASLIKKARQIFSFMLSVIEDKSQKSIFVECASEIVMTLMDKRTSFPKQMKYQVLQIFNKDQFFICSSKTLHCWVKIIDKIIDNNKDHDIFTEYLQKVSLVSSIFSSYTTETKKKIKSFERICFILYAGKKDKYNDKAHLLIQKIIDVIKNAQAPQPVLILIFFCIRILILRTSPERLTKLLANLWQLIMFLLTNIFRKDNDALKQKNNLNLIWAALKLIQMVSIMQLNQFNPHQWIFFYDQLGLKFSSEPDHEAAINFKVKPLISKYLPTSVHPYKDDQLIQTSEQGHLIIKEDKIDDLELLKTKALLLSSYLIRNNQCKMKFDMQEVQALIQNDFLHLDEFIFKFK